VCHVPLTHHERHGLELDRCGACAGLWFDHGELEAYRATHPARDGVAHSWKPDADSKDTPLACPRCGTMSLLRGRALGQLAAQCASCRGVFVSGQLAAKAAAQVAPRPAMRTSSGGGPIDTSVWMIGDAVIDAMFSSVSSLFDV
jgi:Zn-finger nucleic acid-binding protein